MPTWPQFASIEVTDITTHHRDRKSTVLVKTNMHTGTHIEAPIHYSETGKHLGEIPLADLVGTGLVIDLRPLTKPWSYYSLSDVLGCVPQGEEIRDGDIVVLYTGWDQYNWTKPTRDDVMYFDRHPGPQPEVIDYLVDEKKIKWIGADLASMDHSLYVRVRWMLPELMRAVVLTGPNRHEVRDDVPVPRPERLEVLCRVDSVAICGTDLHIYEGRFPGRWPRSYPFTPGHEWSGTVVQLGPEAEVLGWKVGDRVAGPSPAPCGYCRNCRIGRYNLCENYGKAGLHHQYGHYSQGADAEYVVHSVKSVFHMPEELELPYGAMVDTASIALHSVKRPGINPSDVVVVVGAGPMGFLTADCAYALGAATVIVTGSGERLARAADLGFTTIDYRAQDPVE